MNLNAFLFSPARFKDYLELAKIRLVSLSLFSAVVGYYLAAPEPMNVSRLFVTLIGTALVAAGSMSLNQWMEIAEDARMNRTAGRPLPAGRLYPREALVFGMILSVLGILILYFAVNRGSALLAMITLVSYVLVYTPLKKITSLCTIVGAIPGAVPPLIGWAAVTGKPSFEAWVLFTIIFFWQMPHFLAIAWMCRKEYEAAGFRMLSVEDPQGTQVARQMVLYASALLPVSLMPSLVGLTGRLYFFCALGAGVFFVILILTSMKNIDSKARGIFRASILHLTLLLILMMIDKV